MPDLRQQLSRCLQGRVCLMGLGNPDCEDDGFGVRLAEELHSELRGSIPEAQVCSLVAGTAPEKHVGRVTQLGFDHLVFLDAVEFGGMPGMVALLDSAQMQSRFPQVSTHRLSLGLLAKWVEANGVTRVWLLGVQPESVKTGADLTPAVRGTMTALKELISQSLKAPPLPYPPSPSQQSEVARARKCL